MSKDIEWDYCQEVQRLKQLIKEYFMAQDACNIMPQENFEEQFQWFKDRNANYKIWKDLEQQLREEVKYESNI